MNQSQLKSLPSVSEVLLEINQECTYDHRIISLWINQFLSKYRMKAKNGKLDLNREEIIKVINTKILEKLEGSFKTVINGTGIVLHTGFGRAPIHSRLIKNSSKNLEGYSNLEFDLYSGKRGNRQSHITDYFKAYTGAKSSLIVNNNAAAVLLGINTFSQNKEVIVSRGQEVEIGGSFRIPDIIEKSGAILKEVGTTNRTHPSDIERAINSNTGLLLWVHTSNYKIQGFTKDLSLDSMVAIGKKRRIPVMADLGSGALEDLSKLGLPNEYAVKEIVKLNPQLITFSGDKLLGGPQAGVMLGSENIIKKCNKNPIYRSVRCDKFTVSLLQETLKLMCQKSQMKYNLALNLLATPRKHLLKRIKNVIHSVSKKKNPTNTFKIVETEVEAGSGSLPVQSIPSAAIVISSKKTGAKVIAEKFRLNNPPLIGYINKNKFYIDFKAILPKQDKIVKSIILESLS